MYSAEGDDLIANPSGVESGSLRLPQSFEVESVLFAKEHQLEDCQYLGAPYKNVPAKQRHQVPAMFCENIKISGRQEDVDLATL